MKTQSTQARDSRMTLRKNNEEVLRKALQNEARQKCADETRAFGECAKDAGIWVVLSCRKHNLVSCLSHLSQAFATCLTMMIKFILPSGFARLRLPGDYYTCPL